METEKTDTAPPVPSPVKEKGFLDTLFTLDGLPKVFQIVLGASSLFYVTGYLCWAIYAWKNHLGFLSALREQYFAAGAIPLLIMGATWMVIKGHYHFDIWINNKAQTIPITSKKMILILVSIVSVGVLIAFFFEKKLPFFERHEMGIVIAVMFILYITITIRLGLKVDDIINTKLTPILIVAFCPFFIFIYVSLFFPNMPSEFGGPQAKRVQIDIKRANISPQTLSLLTYKGPNDTSAVVRTRPIYLVFDEGDYILFKRNFAAPDTENIPLKIKKESIMGIYDWVSEK